VAQGCCVVNVLPGYLADSPGVAKPRAITALLGWYRAFTVLVGKMDQYKQTNKRSPPGHFLGSEWPEEESTAKSGPSKTRICFNGTARRHYKKQWQEEEQTEKVQSLSTAESDLTGKSVCAKIGAKKCIRPELNIPNPSEDRRGKRPKISDRGPRRQRKSSGWFSFRRAILIEGDDEVGISRKLIKGASRKLIKHNSWTSWGCAGPHIHWLLG